MKVTRLLEGLKGNHDRDGTTTAKGLDFYVTKRVWQLTRGRQQPTTVVPQSLPDFAVAVQ